MRRGLGGFRLDVADELPPRFLRNVRRAIKSADPNGIVIGEVWEDASNKISYGERRAYFQGQELDSVMNYPLKEAIIQFVRSKNTKLFRETVCMLLDHYPKCSLDCLMNILGTHDTVRILTALGGVLAFDKEEMNELAPDPRTICDSRRKTESRRTLTVHAVRRSQHLLRGRNRNGGLFRPVLPQVS